MKRKVFAALCLVAASSAFAQAFTSGRTTAIQFWDGHNGVLIHLDNMINPDSCPRNDYFILDHNNPLFKEIYSLLLALHISKEPVNVGVAGCLENFPRVHVVTSYN